MSSNNTVKIIMIGDSKVGKTAFVTRHLTGDFVTDYQPTVGIHIHPLAFSTSKGDIKLNVWDCAPQELKENYYSGAQAAIIMFDVTSNTSYNNIESWYNFIKEKCPDIPIVLCGNKIDLKERTVLHTDINFHRENSIPYYDISSRSNYNFEKPFLYITRQFFGQDAYFIPVSN